MLNEKETIKRDIYLDMESTSQHLSMLVWSKNRQDDKIIETIDKLIDLKTKLVKVNESNLEENLEL